MKILYKLIGTTIVGRAMKVEPCHEESSYVAKKVTGVKECNKIIVVDDDKNKIVKTYGSEDALKKKNKKTVSRVMFDESLNLTHVYSC